MIDIKSFSKINDLANAYQFTAYCQQGLEAGEYFQYNGYEYLITSEPAFYANQEDEPSPVEAAFTAVRLGEVSKG